MNVEWLRWGLAGVGSRAAKGLVPAAAPSPCTRITAGTRRDAAKGRAFGERHGIDPRVDALVADPAMIAAQATPGVVVTPRRMAEFRALRSCDHARRGGGRRDRRAT